MGRERGWRAGPDLSSVWPDPPPAHVGTGSRTSSLCPAGGSHAGAGLRMQPAGFGLMPGLGRKLPLGCIGERWEPWSATPLMQRFPVMQGPSFSSRSRDDSLSGSSFPQEGQFLVFLSLVLLASLSSKLPLMPPPLPRGPWGDKVLPALACAGMGMSRSCAGSTRGRGAPTTHPAQLSPRPRRCHTTPFPLPFPPVSRRGLSVQFSPY